MSFVDRWLRDGREARYRQAMENYNGGRYDAAVAAFSALLGGEVDPHDPRTTLARFYLAESHCELGWEALEAGALARARDEFLAALQAGYRYPDLHLRLGRIREDLGELEEAAEAYLAALAIHEGLFEARARWVRLRLSQERPVGRELDRLVSDGLTLPDGWQLLGDGGERDAPAWGDGPEARGDSVRRGVIARLEEELNARERVAEQVRTALQAFDELDAETALSQLEAAVALRPLYADLHFRIGVLQARAGRLEEATSALERALELNPQYEEAQRWMARVRTLRVA